MAIHWLSEIANQYPGIQLEVDTLPNYADLVADRWDRYIHDSTVLDSSLIIRTLASFPRTLFASSEHIAARGMSDHSYDLMSHTASGHGFGWSAWTEPSIAYRTSFQ